MTEAMTNRLAYKSYVVNMNTIKFTNSVNLRVKTKKSPCEFHGDFD